MKKKKTNVPVIFSKKFMAQTFCVPERKIGSWGITKTQKVQNGETIYTPCLILKGTRQVIDLIRGEFKTCLKLSWYERKAFPVRKVTQKQGEITFFADIDGKEIEVYLTVEDLQNIYYRKHYIPDITEKQTFL